jgi:Ca2+-binding RTX toxin-like protein
LGDGRIAVTWKSVPDYEDYSFGPIPGIYINQFDALNGTDVDEGRAIGSVGNDNFIGGDGDDLFYGLEGHDDLHGGAGNDVLYGGAGGDLLAGDSGDDRLYTNAGTDYCLGGTEADSITLTADSTWSSGYVAKNISSGDSIGTHQALELTGLNRFSDVIDGGADVDTLILTSGSDAFFIDDVYSGHHESLTLSETSRNIESTARIINLEVINAGDGNDIVDLTSLDFTLSEAVIINGEAGNDTLWGAEGNDTINGGTGNDTLFGGAGDDTLTGGTGQDTFQFTATSGSDTISDFTVSDQDVLEFFYRSGNASDIGDLSLTDGVLNWDTGDDDRTVQIDLSGTMTSGDINDFSDLISFHEIA